VPSDIELLAAHLDGQHSRERVDGCRSCAVLPPLPEEISTEAERPVRVDRPAPPTGRKCRCGCGSPVKRRFLPGHDARLKSDLLKRARKGEEAAARELEELGWGHFLKDRDRYGRDGKPVDETPGGSPVFYS
jgi:hypothetical protein